MYVYVSIFRGSFAFKVHPCSSVYLCVFGVSCSPFSLFLAVSKKGKKLIPELVKNSRIPIVTSVNKFLKNATDSQKEMLNLDILATNLYTLGYQVPTFRKVNLDYTTPIQ